MSQTFNIEPFERFRKQIHDDLHAGGNGPLAQGLNQAGKVYLAAMGERYDRNSAGGGDWPPLAPSTVLGRRRSTSVATNAALSYGPTGRIGHLSVEDRRTYIKLYNRAKKQIKASGGGKLPAVTAKALARAHAFNAAQKAGISIPTRRGIAENLLASGTVEILKDTGTLRRAMGSLFERIDGGYRVGYGGSGQEKDGMNLATLACIHQAGGPHLPARTIIVPPDAATTTEMGNLIQKGAEAIVGGGA